MGPAPAPGRCISEGNPCSGSLKGAVLD
jgi:hypothetical protein